ncbi:MAG: MopE-related protein [Bacteroidota bacterium]
MIIQEHKQCPISAETLKLRNSIRINAIGLFLLIGFLGCTLFLHSQLGGPGNLNTSPTPVFNMDKFIHKVTERFKNPNNPVAGYQLVFVKDGNLYYSESGGAAIYSEDNGTNDIPMLNTTRQNISSVSKFISTLTLANVLEEYGIDWDEPVSDYLNDSWLINMAPEHSNPLSQCYLTFEKLVRHESCLDFGVEGNSGPNPNNIDMQAFLSSDSINMTFTEDNTGNLFDYNDYRNGNFTLTRMLISNIFAINNMGFDMSDPDDVLSEFDSADIYYSLINLYIYQPLGINAPISNNALQDFHNGPDAPRAHQFPFNRDSLTCGGSLGWMAGNPSAPNSAGGSGLALSTLELAEILAFFNNDNNETIISNSQRDYIMNNNLGLAANEVNNGTTPFGDFYFKNGTRGPGCPGGSAPNSIKRATMSFIAIYPNNVELVMLTNSRINFRTAAANDWADCWEMDCNSFVHTTAEGSITDNRSKIENVSTDNNPNKLLFITNNFTSSLQINPSPTASYFENNHWWLYKEDGSNMEKGKRFNVLAFDQEYPLAFRHNHIPNVNGSAPHVSVLDHPELNGKPDAKIFVTQHFDGPSGVLNNHSIGVWYDGNNWTIFNQDLSPMVADASFNVLINHHYLFTENISSPFGSFFGLSEPELPLSEQERSQMIFASNTLSPNGQFNDAEVGVWFTNDQWNIYNENGNFFLGGTKMNILKMEDCECCGENPGEFSNLNFDWCANSPSHTCSDSRDTVLCAEDFSVFQPIAYDQCKTFQTTLNSISQDFSPEGLPRISIQVDLDYFDLNIGEVFTTIVLDTLPPEMIGIPEDMIVSCNIPPIPEVIVVTDNCSENIIPELVEVTEGEDCNFKITRTFTAIDSAGNSSTQSYCIYSGTYADQDNDGTTILEDCDDNDPTIFPGANELCDGLDNDCDELIDEQCMDCIADNFLNAPSGMIADQSINAGTATQLKWNHYSDASDGCILQGATSDGINQTSGLGSILIQGSNVQGNNEGYDFSSALSPNSTYLLFNPTTFPNGNFNQLIPGETYMWRVRCGCVIDFSIPLPDRLALSNLHLSPWSPFNFFDNLNNAPIHNNAPSNYQSKSQGVSSSLSLYPNPSGGEIGFNSPGWEGDVFIEIIDLQGRKVFSNSYSHLPQSIVVEQFNSGIHFVKLTSKTDVITLKIFFY